MRWIACLILLIAAVFWLAAETPPATELGTQANLCWRRTQNGWEHATWLADSIPNRRPALHPAVVGTLELLLSTMALVAFADRPRRKSRPTLKMPPKKTASMLPRKTASRRR